MSDREKWAFLERAPGRDATEPALRDTARSLHRAALGDARVFVHLAHALARDGIRYKTDTARVGGEDIAGYTRRQSHALEALERGTDDCDAKARLFVALCLAAGLRARMVPKWDGAILRHVSAAVVLAGKEYPVETILARARLGDTETTVPTEKESRRWLYT